MLDPDIVAHFLGRQAARNRLAELTERERDVLAAHGRRDARTGPSPANSSLTEKTVETHIASIFAKLDLLPEPDDHRRVLAVRAWLDQ